MNLTITLARTEFKLRYFGSVLGYLWSLFGPLLFFGVLYVVFTQVFSLGKSIPHYPVYLLTSIMMWTFFVETTAGCVQCLVVREALLRKMRFPRLVIPLSVALTALFNLAINSIVVIGISPWHPALSPGWSWLELPLLVALLADPRGRHRDAAVDPLRAIPRHPADLGCHHQVLFYCSPIIYTAAKYPSSSCDWRCAIRSRRS